MYLLQVTKFLDTFRKDPRITKRISQAALILVLALLSFKSAHAKGAPAMLKIKGPGITDVLEITDEELLESFGWGEFADFDAPIVEKPDLEGGYVITRYVLMGGTTMRSLDTFTYYPGSGDGYGIVFYKGIIDKNFIYGGSPQDGKWFHVSAQGEAAIQRIFKTYHISTSGIPTLSLNFPISIPVWMIYGIILAAIGTLILLRQRN